MKSDLNVFTYGYAPLTYWKNWFSNIKQFFRNIKYAWQRATKGYCDQDVWNLDYYYTELMRDTLRDLAEDHMGHPFEFEYKDEENPDGSYTVIVDKWKDFLNETALLLDKSIERSFDDFQYFKNKYEEEYCKTELIYEDLPDGGGIIKHHPKDEDIINKYLEEERKIDSLRDECKNQALDNIKKYWWHLWD